MSPQKLYRTSHRTTPADDHIIEDYGAAAPSPGGVHGKHLRPNLSDKEGDSGALQMGPPSPSLNKLGVKELLPGGVRL